MADGIEMEEVYGCDYCGLEVPEDDRITYSEAGMSDLHFHESTGCLRSAWHNDIIPTVILQ